jgi:hypothetical protein
MQKPACADIQCTLCLWHRNNNARNPTDCAVRKR